MNRESIHGEISVNLAGRGSGPRIRAARMRCVQVVPALYAVVTKMSSSRGAKWSQRVLSRWWLRYSRVRSGGSSLMRAHHRTRRFSELSRTNLMESSSSRRTGTVHRHRLEPLPVVPRCWKGSPKDAKRPAKAWPIRVLKVSPCQQVTVWVAVSDLMTCSFGS